MNELLGFTIRLATYSAGHLTDGKVSYAAARQFGNGRHEELVSAAEQVGLVTRPTGSDRGRVWTLVQDPTLFHIRSRDEVEWERQRDRDRSNTALTLPVRVRDGDACRYCGNVVNFSDHRGARGGTFDHREPGSAGTVDTLVVACRACNAARRDHQDADLTRPLLPVPQRPYYHSTTSKYLRGKGFDVKSGPRPGRSKSNPPVIQRKPNGDPNGDSGSTDRDPGRVTGRVGSGREPDKEVRGPDASP